MGDFNNFLIELRVPDGENASFNLKRIATTLFNENQFCDVTISCKDGQIQAHRMILCSASTYLYKLFTTTPWPTPCSHPVILLRNSRVDDVRSVMEYIYTGTTKTSKNKLQAIMEIGRELECTSLLKSIEISLQNCGIAMFRSLVSNSNNNIINMPTPTSSANNKNKNKPVKVDFPTIIKKEPIDLHEHNNGGSDHPTSNYSFPKLLTNGSTNNNKSDKMRNSQSQIVNRNGNKFGGSQNNKNRHNLLSTTTIEPLNSNITMEYSQAESFVYTNKDLGMEFSDAENNNEEEYNNSNDTEMRNSQQSSHNNSGISVTSISNITSKSQPDIFIPSIPIKVEMNNEDSDGVPASCPWCLQIFTNLTLLQRHIKTHVSVDKPKFVCEYCNTKFGRSAHLKRHLRTHTGEKPYSCGICQTRFARQDKLKIHLERHLQNANTAVAWNTNNNNNNTSMTVTTSYPPQPISQSLGGHLPIKVLIPMNNGKLSSLTTNNNLNGSLDSSSSSPPSSTIVSNGSLSISPLSSTSFTTGAMRIEKVAKNLSPSTTITTISNGTIISETKS